MGLEAVEIVIQVEEAFGISIKDSEAEKMVTPGDLIEHVIIKVGRHDHVPCLKQRAFHRIRASLMRRFDLKREQIRLETQLGDLVPRSARKNDFNQVLKELGVHQNINLIRPICITNLITVAVLAGSLAATGFIMKQPFVHFNMGALVFSTFFFGILFGWLAAQLTHSQRHEFEPSLGTVEKLSRWVVANSSNLVEPQPGQWNREQVAEKVRGIVIHVLDCEKEYREEAEFVRDLGMG